MEQPSPLPHHEMRTSDADRDRAASILGQALAEGRLSAEEHAERLDALYASKTFGELNRLTRDLPGSSAAPTAAHRAAPGLTLSPDYGDTGTSEVGSPAVTAIFGGAQRRGRWTVPPHLLVTAVFGSVTLDLREAVLMQREVTIIANCLCGAIDIIVPKGVDVEDSGTAVFGRRDSLIPPTGQADAPLIRLKGTSLFGGVTVRRKGPKVLARLKARGIL